MFHFTTFFDKNYLSRGLVLYNSLKTHCNNFELYILCLDTDTKKFFEENAADYPQVKLLELSEIEHDDERLLAAKQNRSRVEYYFTLSPCLPLYLLKTYQLPHVCSLDADIMFFGSVNPIFDLLENYSVLITPHKFSDSILNDGRIKYGIYNVSFQVFKNNNTGIACLEKWKTECTDWCYDHYDEANGGRFADQKYLDNWHADYPGEVASLDMDAAGLAVWNIDNYHFTLKNGSVLVNNQELIFFHFHHFKIVNSFLALNGFYEYKVKNGSAILLNNVFLAYWNALDQFNLLINQKTDNSARQNLKKSFIRLLLIHRTGFFRKFNTLFKLNVTLLHVIYLKLKKS